MRLSPLLLSNLEKKLPEECVNEHDNRTANKRTSRATHQLAISSKNKLKVITIWKIPSYNYKAIIVYVYKHDVVCAKSGVYTCISFQNMECLQVVFVEAIKNKRDSSFQNLYIIVSLIVYKCSLIVYKSSCNLLSIFNCLQRVYLYLLNRLLLCIST